MSDVTRKREAPEPRLVALFVAAVTACALWAEQPHARAFDRGVWHDVAGWPFVSTFHPATTNARHLPLGELANVLSLGVIAVCVYCTTLQVARWIANRGRVSLRGMMLAVTTAAVASSVLLGRFDDLADGAVRSIGLLPSGIDERSLWLICARLSMVHVMCVVILIGTPALARQVRNVRARATCAVVSHDRALSAE